MQLPRLLGGMDVTVLELHFPEAQFNAPFAGHGNTDESPAEATANGDGSGPGSIAAFLVLIGLAALAWYVRRGRETEPPP